MLPKLEHMPDNHLGLVDGLHDIHICSLYYFKKICPKISSVVAFGLTQEEPQEERNV